MIEEEKIVAVKVNEDCEVSFIWFKDKDEKMKAAEHNIMNNLAENYYETELAKRKRT